MLAALRTSSRDKQGNGHSKEAAASLSSFLLKDAYLNKNSKVAWAAPGPCQPGAGGTGQPATFVIKKR